MLSEWYSKCNTEVLEEERMLRMSSVYMSEVMVLSATSHVKGMQIRFDDHGAWGSCSMLTILSTASQVVHKVCAATVYGQWTSEHHTV